MPDLHQKMLTTPSDFDLLIISYIKSAYLIIRWVHITPQKKYIHALECTCGRDVALNHSQTTEPQ